ncbi:hypothetical protein HJFPF1_06467 [Paramyrothecium foliicola]|nr:hypothetical protein HJFPF1_06467 [Paramyrothecium foliicola]
MQSVPAPRPRSGLRLLLQLEPVPAPLRPLVRAYILGYASSVLPRLLALLVRHVTTKRSNNGQTPDKDDRPIADSVTHILKTALERHRFPAFCAALAGGTSLLQDPARKFVDQISKSSYTTRLRLARWIAGFVAGWLSLQLLHSNKQNDLTASKRSRAKDHSPKPGAFTSRTLDLTLFAVTRAVDVIIGELWSQRKARRQASNQWTKLEQLVSYLVDPMVFAASSGLIMWAWFYNPAKLPRGYGKWISSAAAVDGRLIEALRQARKGNLQYGEDTGCASILVPMCEQYKWPSEWGDPAKTAPFPCEMVHMGRGPSCEYHALARFFQSWKWSMLTYVPLSLALVLRKPTRKSVIKAIISASRSSAFLGLFISLFYYGVCLTRNRIGLRLLGKDAASCQRIDGGLCVGTGCFLCGWSILAETAGRHKDLSLFVAPRALGTVVPRQWSRRNQWRETAAFAASAAVVFTCVLENPQRVRGVLGKILAKVMQQ